MSLFRCAHYVPIGAMEEVSISPDEYVGGILHAVPGAVARYKGFCMKCHAYVSLTEEIQNRALYAHLRATPAQSTSAAADKKGE